MLCRSYLFAPGDNEKLLGKVFNAGADAVVLDLEDAVAPDRKAVARQMVADALEQVDNLLQLYVRINAVTTEFWRDDVQAVVHANLHGLRVAKAESVEQLREISIELDEAEHRAGLAVGKIRLTPTIESAVGLLAVPEMARHPRVESFCFGAADFCYDLGIETDETESQTLFARSQLVLHSRAAGIQPPIAAVHTQLKDLDGLRATTAAARRLGFFGRSCIHPSQLATIHGVFTPTAEQIAQARAVLAAFEQADSAALKMADGQFIDRPIVERARAIIALAEMLET
jgi:citrate lyase subunit beta/citryl-CoA lyase